MHRQHAKDGLALISVSVDELGDNPEEIKAAVTGFLRKQGADCTNLLLDDDPAVWQAKLRFAVPPCYYVFDREGRWTCFSSENENGVDYKGMDQLILKLLKK